MRSASEPIRDFPVRPQGAARGAITMLIASAATSASSYRYAKRDLAGRGYRGRACVRTKGPAAVFLPVPTLFRLLDHDRLVDAVHTIVVAASVYLAHVTTMVIGDTVVTSDARWRKL